MTFCTYFMCTFHRKRVFCLSIILSVYLLVWVLVYLSDLPPVGSSTELYSFCLTIYHFAYLYSIHMFVYLSIHTYVYMFVYLSICKSVTLSWDQKGSKVDWGGPFIKDVTQKMKFSKKKPSPLSVTKFSYHNFSFVWKRHRASGPFPP